MFNWLWNLLGLNMPVTNTNVDTTTNKLVHYRLNDPTTPQLTIDIEPPKMMSTMPFQVLGYIGGGYPVDTLESQAANNHVTIANATKFVQSCATKPFTGWAATKVLVVNVRAGQDLNAYYDRRGLKFFYMPDRKLGKTVYAADSADVVAHELGHAILDSLRPDFWNLQCLETAAFHEGYGDINAMLSQLAYPEVIQYVLKETGGNLRKSNVVSKLAEELGTALYDVAHYGKPGVLRDAVNSFVYAKPGTLPQSGPDDDCLIAECHSFGRLMMGAWYDMLVGIYELELKTNKPENALAKARDVAGRYILAGASQAPAVSRFYDSVGRTMLSWGKTNGKPEYNAIIQKVLQDRKIIAPQIKVLSNVKFEALHLHPDDVVVESGNKKMVKRTRTEKVTLAHELGFAAQGANPLFNAEIEIPRDTYLEFEDGSLVDEISDSRDDVIESARMSLVQLHQNGLVGTNDKCTHELTQQGDKEVLVRTKFID